MAFYVALLHGSGIRIDHDMRSAAALGLQPCDPEEDSPVVGFYTTRWVRAKSEADAVNSAKSLLFDEWNTAPLCDINHGSLLELEVDSIRRIGWFTYLRRRPGRGHTFYSEDALSDARMVEHELVESVLTHYV